MKGFKTHFLTFLALGFWTLSVSAQSSLTFTWIAPLTATPSAPSTNFPTNPSLVQGNNNGTTPFTSTTSASTGYTGATGGGNYALAARIGALNTGANGSAFVEFTITPLQNVSYDVTNISFGTRSTATGPQAYAIYKIDGGVESQVTTGLIDNNSSWALKDNPVNIVVNPGAVVTYRIYGYNGTGTPALNTANWRLDDIVVTLNNIVNNAPAPVDMSDLFIENKKEVNTLNFITYREVNNDYFMIERSEDAQSFTAVGKLTGSGNSNEAIEYIYQDKAPKTGMNYYRVKQVDLDGAVTYSNVVFAKNNIATTDWTYNIENQVLVISNSDLPSDVVIYSINGQIVEKNINVIESLDLSHLPTGKYVIQITTNKNYKSIKWVKP
jgi:hypothetical protein